MLHKNTFGDSPAAIILVEKLNNSKDETNRISRMSGISRTINKFNRTLHELEKIDSKIAIGLGKLSYHHYSVSFIKLPIPFNTYAHNVLCSIYKKWLVKQNAKTPYKLRKK